MHPTRQQQQQRAQPFAALLVVVEHGVVAVTEPRELEEDRGEHGGGLPDRLLPRRGVLQSCLRGAERGRRGPVARTDAGPEDDGDAGQSVEEEIRVWSLPLMLTHTRQATCHEPHGKTTRRWLTNRFLESAGKEKADLIFMSIFLPLNTWKKLRHTRCAVVTRYIMFCPATTVRFAGNSGYVSARHRFTWWNLDALSGRKVHAL